MNETTKKTVRKRAGKPTAKDLKAKRVTRAEVSKTTETSIAVINRITERALIFQGGDFPYKLLLVLSSRYGLDLSIRHEAESCRAKLCFDKNEFRKALRERNPMEYINSRLDAFEQDVQMLQQFAAVSDAS